MKNIFIFTLSCFLLSACKIEPIPDDLFACFKVETSSCFQIDSLVRFDAGCSSLSTKIYKWDFDNDGTIDMEGEDKQRVSHAFTTEGDKTIKLRVENKKGVTKDTTITICVAVDTINSPVAKFTVVNDSCIAPCTVEFLNNSLNAVSYKWDFGDGSPISEEENPSHYYVNSGLFEVVLTASGNNMLKVQKRDTVTIKALTFKKNFGGAGFQEGNCVRQTSDGGYIITGYTKNNATNDTNLYIVKTDAEGVVTKTQYFGGSSVDIGFSVRQTANGDYIVVGYTQNPSNLNNDLYLIKKDGNLENGWEKTYSGNSLTNDIGYDVEQTISGNYASIGVSDNKTYLINVNDAGDLIGQQQIFNTATAEYSEMAIQQTTDEGFIVCGTANNGANKLDVFLLKINSVGDIEWGPVYYGGPSNDYGHSVQQTTDGGFIIAGSYDSGANTGSSKYDVYLIKTDALGNETIDTTYGGNQKGDVGFSVQQTTDGGFIVVGYSYSYNSTGGTENETDVYLIKTDENLNYSWYRHFGGIRDDQGKCVRQTSDGGYIIVGYSTNDIGNDKDVYLIKTDKDGKIQ